MSVKRTSTIDRKIGSLVRDRREILGLSQTEIGKKIGVTFQQIQKYENGVNRISCSALLKIAKALGSSICDFMPDEGNSSVDAGHNEALTFAQTREGQRLIQAYLNLNHDVRANVAGIILSVANGPQMLSATAASKVLVKSKPANGRIPDTR